MPEVCPSYNVKRGVKQPLKAPFAGVFPLYERRALYSPKAKATRSNRVGCATFQILSSIAQAQHSGVSET